MRIKAKSITTIATTEISKTKTFFKATLALFILSFLFQLVVSSKFAVKNGDLKAALATKTALTKEISQLEYEDSLLSSLERVETTALDLGYIAMSSKVKIIESPKLASLKSN